MGYPPKFAGSTPQSSPEYTYSSVLNLDQLDVYKSNGSEYFDVKDLPTRVGYGKHYFTISFKDPENSNLYLREKSSILFELKDSQGTVIYSDLTGYDDINGAAIGYFWIKKDPLRTYDQIEEGIGYLTIVGELDNVPDVWKNVYNVRLQIPVDIRKDLPNTSPVLFQSSSLIQSSLVISESVEYDSESSVYQRSMINVSASHLETYGGQLKFVEVLYNEDRANNNEYKLLTTYEVSSSGEEYEISSSDATGLNPVSNLFKTPMPRDLRRGGDVSFRLRFLNSTNEVATDITTGIEVVVSSSSTFEGTPIIIEKDDNLLTGSMGIGSAVGRGFKMSGENSAYFMSQDYTGFTSGSAGSGSGILMWSGSVLSSITDDYSNGGVGLELMSDSSSYFRFRSNPKELDIRADAFFVGSEGSQFISASGGVIEISSSNFHLSSSGDVYISGSIDATDGTIGGYTIGPESLTARSSAPFGGNISMVSMSVNDTTAESGTGALFGLSSYDDSADGFKSIWNAKADKDNGKILTRLRNYEIRSNEDNYTEQLSTAGGGTITSTWTAYSGSSNYAKTYIISAFDASGNPNTRFYTYTGNSEDITDYSDLDGTKKGFIVQTYNDGTTSKHLMFVGNEAYESYIKFDGTGLTISSDVSGSSTSTGSFGLVMGDGSGLYNLPSAAITAYNKSGNTRLITSVDTTTVQGEAGLTYDGSILNVEGSISGSSTGSFSRIEIIHDNADEDFFLLKSGSFISHKINAEGILEFGGFSYVPTPVEGGVYYNNNEREFYLGA